MTGRYPYIFSALFIFMAAAFITQRADARALPGTGLPLQQKDTTPTPAMQDTLPFQDSLKFPIYDRRTDRISAERQNAFDLKDPANIRDSIVYDPKEKKYYILEKVSDVGLR